MAISLLGFDYPELVWRLIERTGLGLPNEAQIAAIGELADQLVAQNHKARAITERYCRTVGVEMTADLSMPELLAIFQRSGRLDQYARDVFPLLLTTPELRSAGSATLARVFDLSSSGAYSA
jgi:hypothetical protein